MEVFICISSFALKTHALHLFQLDMTTEERAIMIKHVAYWSEKAEKGYAIVFGPVTDPKGGYGIGVYQVQDEAQMLKFLKNDPANELLQYEVLPMARAIVGNIHP